MAGKEYTRHYLFSSWSSSLVLPHEFVHVRVSRYLILGATLSISDVLGDNPLHFLSKHGVLSQLSQKKNKKKTYWIKYNGWDNKQGLLFKQILLLQTNGRGISVIISSWMELMEKHVWMIFTPN